jgi:hypothetical protein
MSDCLRCRRPKTAKIHDTIGRQGTGTSAVHAFIGDREAAILQYAAGQLGWSEKSRPHGLRPGPEMALWNDAIEAAKCVLFEMTQPINPQELADYDKYWGKDETEPPVTPIVIAIPKTTFIVGDWKPKVFEEFGELDVRPIYGPPDGNNRRQLVGVIRVEESTPNSLQRLEAMLEYADANMPKEDA